MRFLAQLIFEKSSGQQILSKIALDIVLTLELNLCDRVTEHLHTTALDIVLTLELNLCDRVTEHSTGKKKSSI
jgi:hypothetical protein